MIHHQHEHDQLIRAGLDLVWAIDLCFGDGDDSYTETLPFRAIANALTGESDPDADGINIENLRNVSRRFRDALAASVSSNIRHHANGHSRAAKW